MTIDHDLSALFPFSELDQNKSIECLLKIDRRLLRYKSGEDTSMRSAMRVQREEPPETGRRANTAATALLRNWPLFVFFPTSCRRPGMSLMNLD